MRLLNLVSALMAALPAVFALAVETSDMNCPDHCDAFFDRCLQARFTVWNCQISTCLGHECSGCRTCRIDADPNVDVGVEIPQVSDMTLASEAQNDRCSRPCVQYKLTCMNWQKKPKATCEQEVCSNKACPCSYCSKYPKPPRP